MSDIRTEIVHRFIAAFNAHDVDAMAALVTEDVRWLSVGEDVLSVEVAGKQALVTAMSEYFESCPTCRSEIHGLISSGQRVSVVEVANWSDRNGPRSQRSMAVYDFSGRLIRGVYYFPEEP